jgi:multicomponent Na+:H+ antiporter subunit E
LNKRIANYGLMALGLGAVWLLLSGHTEPLLLAFGAASVILTLVVAWRMDVLDPESHPVHAAVAYIPLWPWMAWEILKSNLDVARRILSPSLPISPCVFELRATQRSVLGRVVYANAITLTPGTLTMNISGQRFEIHALTVENRTDLESGAMDRRVTRAEGIA